jgi:hypothetical protein
VVTGKGGMARRLFAVAVMTVGLGVWVYTAVWLTPAVKRIQNGADDPGELHIWVQEQREVAIGLVVAALVLILIGRGRVVRPALAAYFGLFIVDCVVDAHGLTGWRTAAVTVAIGTAVLAAAGWLPALAVRRMVDPIRVRRVVGAVAVSAALVAPLLSADYSPAGAFPHLPVGLFVTGPVVMVLLWCVAVALACHARSTPLPRSAVAVYLVGPIAGVAAAVAVWSLVASDSQQVTPFAMPMLAILVVAVVIGWRALRPWIWLLLGLASVLATEVFVFLAVEVGWAVGGTVMQAVGYDSADGVPFLAGAIPLAIGVGACTAKGLRRQPSDQFSCTCTGIRVTVAP